MTAVKLGRRALSKTGIPRSCNDCCGAVWAGSWGKNGRRGVAMRRWSALQQPALLEAILAVIYSGKHWVSSAPGWVTQRHIKHFHIQAIAEGHGPAPNTAEDKETSLQGAYPNLPMSLLDHESGKPPWLSALSMLLKRGMRVMTKMPYAV